MKLPVANIPYTYLGLPQDWESSKVAVLPVPYDSTASYKTGMRHGPGAIIEASRNLELYDIETGKDFSSDIGFFTLPEVMCPKKDPQLVIEAVEKSVDAILKNGRFPLMLGGEHSITSGAVKACFKKYKDIAVLHIDAHADMRHEYEETPYNHACVMARCRENVPVVSVGIRSMSEEEAQTISKKYKDAVFDASRLDAKRIAQIVSKIKAKYVYITIDIDGFDPSVMPGVGTPEPGGLLWNETLDLLKAVCKEKEVVGADVVELMPLAGNIVSDFACAKLAYKLCGYALGK